MSGVFYHSVIHGLGFFICFMILILRAQNNKTRFFYVLYSDKTWVFDQSERAHGPIYVIINNKQLLDEVEHDIMNYQNRGLCYLPKPNRSEAFSHFVSEENTPRGLVTRQTLNLT